MKKELSSLELRKLTEELQILLDARVDQIFQPRTREILITFHKTSQGKLMFRIQPSVAFITKIKGENPQNPPKFCMNLRKNLKSSRIKSIKQVDSERILEIMLTTKDNTFYLYIELFSKGNIVLCDKDKKIIMPLDNQTWKERTVKRGEVYTYPKKDVDTLNTSKENITQVLSKSKKAAVKAIATDLGIGGLYAEELLSRLKLDKDTKLKESSLSEVYKALQKMLKEKPKGYVYRYDGEVTHIVPIKLSKESKDPELHASFNEALDMYLSKEIAEKEEKKITSKYTKQIRKYEVMIETQQASIEKLEEKMQEAQRKGEILYEQYGLFNEIRDQINKEAKKSSWQAIKKKLAGNNIIKDVNTKEKSVTVEVP